MRGRSAPWYRPSGTHYEDRPRGGPDIRPSRPDGYAQAHLWSRGDRRGRHVTTIVKTWKFILKAARAFNVQIFATTHSDDCLRGIAEALQQESNTSRDDVTMHRLAMGQPEPVSYSAKEIIDSANNGIEVRF